MTAVDKLFSSFSAIRRHSGRVLALLLLLTLCAGSVQAQSNKGAEISPSQAAAIAQQRYPGKVVSVKRNNGSYKVKLLHEGQVRVVTISARK
ncbi:PepSY domain-containing protein [Pseudomaricurvus sp. HS19]|uniref:PepSY domain-containing protein n=1 Tax=Pseudomaricurvus sp. HS19 TaxID=2692626 RepID=UPI00136B43E6|nr:PepSY domain-containing protein [Pseudomaricurvus sp. HS19]MYM64765.1 hypothetical protein [Pseudomaricurvus sp. HS19]